MRIAIGQTGAPTAVVDETLRGFATRLLGAGHELLGVRGSPSALVAAALEPITAQDVPQPGPRGGSWLGGGRRAVTPADVAAMVDVLDRLDVDGLALIGGNGTMALLDAIATEAARRGSGLRVVGIPKTIDNDLTEIDHAPGYASAARFLAKVVPDIARDQHAMQGVEAVRVVETLGRSVGWLALAASAHRDDPSHAPDLVLIPEVPIDVDRLTGQIDKVLADKGRAFVVVSEGVQLGTDDDYTADNHTTLLHGGVARQIAAHLAKALKVQARGEVLGMVQRSASALASATDVAEAATVGALAADLLRGEPDEHALDVTAGTDAVMVGFTRVPGTAYELRFATVPLTAVAGRKHQVPEQWQTDDPRRLEDFYDWLAPLIA